MAQFRFGPLDRLEDRTTPAANWQLGIANAGASEGLLKNVAQYIVGTNQDTSFTTVKVAPAVRDSMATIVTQSQAAAQKVRAMRDSLGKQIAANPALWKVYGNTMQKLGGLLFQLQVNEQLARNLGGRVGTNFNPTPTPTPTGPNDSGMTNTLPSITDPRFVDQGNGLKIWDIRTGTGPVVAAGSKIKIYYTGWLLNGTKFDSRRSPQTPIEFDLDGLIQGWQQGIPGMKAGGIRRLYIPSALAYGAAGQPPSIPANSDLVFEIKVISSSP